MSVSDDKFYRARITQRVDLGPTLWRFRIRADGDFSFSPGQYATLGLQDPDSKRWERPYSIVSAPFEREIEFFLELVPGGDLTPRLYKLQLGDELFMRKSAKGRLTLDTHSGRANHLLICTVTGVAPFVSYARALYQQRQEGKFSGEHKLFLLHGASRSCEFGYCDELQRFAAEVSWLLYVPTVSRPWEDRAWRGETGRVDDIIRKYADKWGLNGSNTIAYLCGHPEMIENGKGILRRIGFEKEFLKEESYWVPGKEAAAS
jgi:ferredoxin/flavodoxin---NADP+ reductase